MHSACYLAVTAPDLEGALAAAEDFLTPYQGHVYDYYSIGGRWSGTLGGGDAVCASDQRRCFLDAVERGRAWLAESYQDIRQTLAGPDPRHVQPDRTDGDDDGRYEAILGRTWAGYRSSSERFRHLLGGAEIDHRGDLLLAHQIRRFADFVDGRFTIDCSFYDTVERTTSARDLLARVDSNPGDQWVVVCDLHS